MRYLKRLWLLVTSGPELDEVIEQQRRARLYQEAENNRYRLKLCFKHRQESRRSHYAEHNCDHCNLQRQLGNANEN